MYTAELSHLLPRLGLPVVIWFIIYNPIISNKIYIQQIPA